MRRWANFVTRNPGLVILLNLLLTLFFLYHTKYLHFENRFTSWFPRSDPVLRTFLMTGERFGTNELIMVALKAKEGETFSPEVLERVKKLTEALKEKPEVFLVTSITNSPDIRKIEGGIEVRDLLEEIPRDTEELKSLKKYILSKETFVNNVISADGKWLAVAIYLRTSEKSDPIKSFQEVIKPTVEEYLGDIAEVYYSGDPSDAYFANEFSTGDLKKLTPMVVLLILLVLFFSFKSWKGVFYPLLVVLLSTVWTFGTMGLLRKPMDLLTPILPVLLIALGSAYGIHVLNKILHEDSVEKATAEIFVPVLMAGLTTIAGFVSFASAKLSLIINLGLFSALGIFYAMVIALSLIPALMSLHRGRPSLREERYGYSALLRPLSRLVFERKELIAGIFLLIFLFFSLWIPGIRREVNFTEYYPKDSVPRISLGVVKEHFAGAYPLTIYIKADSFKNPEVLRVMRLMEYYLYSIKEASLPMSAGDFLQELNFQLNGRYQIPESRGEVANLWFFMEGREELSQVITPDERQALIFAKLPESSTTLMRKTYLRIENFLRSFSGGFEAYRLEGLSPLQRRQVRRAETLLVEKQIRWLAEKYGVELTGSLQGVWEEVPAPDAPEVLEKFRGKIAGEILAADFDFELSRARAEALLKDILTLASHGTAKEDNFMGALRRRVPRDQWDEETARDVSRSFLYRLRESRREVFVEKAWGRLGAKGDNPYFNKKARGLLWEIADDLAVLPSGTLPFRGERVRIEKITQSGFPAAMTRLDSFLYISQLQSLAIALVLTFLLMVALRGSLALGAISTTPILFTLGVIYGFLGLSGIPLTYATMMIAGVSIGVGIDYAIHFIHGVYSEMGERAELSQAIEQTFVEKGKAILSNSIAVILGFGVLLFSRLKPLHQFGATMMGSMFLAALAALSFLPSLLLILIKKGKGGEK